MSKLREYPDQITQPNFRAYQVRVVRDGVEYSASFSWAKLGSPVAALSAAVAWRDEKLRELPSSGNAKGSFRAQSLPHKRSGERVGVTRYLRRDRRKQGNPAYLTFGVSWVDVLGHRRVKSFQVGRLGEFSDADERHARATANAFRDDYEYSLTTGKRFDSTLYAEWKTRVLYPFRGEPLLNESNRDTLG